MDNKNLRLTQIKEIIQNQRITSQDQLLKSLITFGFTLTQATLSRDIKLLKIAKIPDGQGAYRYVLPESITSEPELISNALEGGLNGFKSLEFSGNLGVIKTVEAFSNTIALKIDKARMKEIVGTISGDDTLFFVIRDGYNTEQVKQALIDRFPELVHKLI